MGILVLNLSSKTGWAICHKDKVREITSGTHAFRDAARFQRFLNDLLYNHDPIDHIYYQLLRWKDRFLYLDVKNSIKTDRKATWVDAKKSCKGVLGVNFTNQTQVINYIKTLGHMSDNTPDNIEEACAITTAYHLSSKNS